MKDSLDKHVYTENLDYSQTQNSSIWGEGDPGTWELLRKLDTEGKIAGKWLHYAAGDGRYNNWLLSRVENVVATDIDSGALSKLQSIVPEELKPKLSTKEQDITKDFPFSDNSFDGVFNTGTLHLFPEEILHQVFSETERILKPGGTFLFDFATDIKRIRKDGSMIKSSDTEYPKSRAKTVLKKLLTINKFEYSFIACDVPPEEVTSGEGTYSFSCNYWLVVATKND